MDKKTVLRTFLVLTGQIDGHCLDDNGNIVDYFYENSDGSLTYLTNGMFGPVGSNQVTVNGTPVTITFSAQAAQTIPYVLIDEGAIYDNNTASPFQLMLPGDHSLQYNGVVLWFHVNPDGSISVPASESNELSVQADGSLLVNALS